MTDPTDAVAAWGLPTEHRLPERPLDDEQFRALLATCTHERVLGLLGAAVRAGAFPVTAGQRAELDARWQEWLGHTLRAERLALAVLEALRGAGIRAAAIKGTALAHTIYAEPAQRVFGDVDLLVEPNRLREAGCVVAGTLGGTRAEPELRPGFDDRFARELLVRVGDLEVDLHRTFVNGAYGIWADVRACLADVESVSVGGQTMPVLGPADRLLHAAYASVLSDWPPRRVAIRDLAEAVRDRDHTLPGADDIVARARSWRGEAVLAAAVRRAWRVLGLTTRPVLLDWAEHHHAGSLDRLLLRANRGAARGYTGQLTSLVALPGTAARVAYLRALAWPSREYRHARNLGPLGLLGAGLRRARRG